MSGQGVTRVSPLTSSSTAGRSPSPAQGGDGAPRAQSTFFPFPGASAFIRSEGESGPGADDAASPILQPSTVAHRSWPTDLPSRDKRGKLRGGEKGDTGAEIESVTEAETKEPPDQVDESPPNGTSPAMARATPGGTQGRVQSGNDTSVRSVVDEREPPNGPSPELARSAPGCTQGRVQSGNDTPGGPVAVGSYGVREAAEESKDGRGQSGTEREPLDAVPLMTALPLPEAKTLMQAVQNGVPAAAVATLLHTMDEAQAFEELLQTSLVVAMAENSDGDVAMMVLDAMLEHIPVRQVAGVYSSAFHDVTVGVQGFRDRKSLASLSMLLEHGAKPDPEDLVLLSRTVESESLEECFVRAVSAAGNAFIPSLNISFGLDHAIRVARDMERRVLIQLRHGVNRLLAETLRWLPQTVRDLPGGMVACTALFEPELTCMHQADGTDGPGPLAVALRCSTRVLTFATTPLAMDYMFQNFSRGLPGLLDGDRVVLLEVPSVDSREEGKGHDSLTAYTVGSTLGTVMTALGKTLACGSLCGLTLLPGAHFVATGMVSVTNSYYKTPVMRMVFDFIVYAGFLALFTVKVLYHNDGTIEGGEIAFIVWVVASFVVEIDEMRRDLDEYVLDRWNVFDLSALSLCLAAFVIRAVDYDIVWGRSLYALAAPLLYWRLLFYAQVLPFQGAMIQVIFSMSSVLVQFGIVMGVVMVGFAVAFFALVREFDDSTFKDSLLNVFVAMLGEVSLFDEFAGTPFKAVGTLLLATYLIIMSIMLLNLLVAVLSTSHAKLEGHVLIRVSRARVYMTYRWVVGDDVLPSPFNLLQLAAVLPCAVFDLLAHGKSHAAVRQGLGRVAFWLVMGPVAIVAGSLLWLASLPKALVVVWRASVARPASIVSRVGNLLLCVAWSTVGVPICLTASWLAQIATVVQGQTGTLESSSPPTRVKVSIDKMLKESTRGLGMAEVRMSLVDPVSSTPYYFNRSAHDRSATVGDVQLLRKRLEEHVDEVKGCMTEKKKGGAAVEDRLHERVDKLEEKLDMILSMLLTRGNAALPGKMTKQY